MSYSVTLKNGAPVTHAVVELAMDIYHEQSGNADEYIVPEDAFLGKYMELDYNGWELIGDGEIIAHLCWGMFDNNVWRLRNFDEWEPDKYFSTIEVETKGKVNKTMLSYLTDNIGADHSGVLEGMAGYILHDCMMYGEPERYNSNKRIDWEAVRKYHWRNK